MRLIEIPEATIEREIEALTAILTPAAQAGPHTTTYTHGAVAALSWLLTGARPPHECGPDTPAAPRAPRAPGSTTA
jgi:hypothetical protein